MNFIRRFWWLIFLLLILLPVFLNYVLNFNIGASIIGEPKDWLLFWGTYISSVSSLWMIILTYLIIKQNDKSRQGVLVASIVYNKGVYFLEITNVGNSICYDIAISINESFNEELHHLSNVFFTKFQNRKFSLKPDESKRVLIEHATEGCHEKFNPEKNQLEPVSLSEEYLNKIKSTPLELTGSYYSIGNRYYIEQSLIINDFNMGFIVFSTTLDDEMPKITKAIKDLKMK